MKEEGEERKREEEREEVLGLAPLEIIENFVIVLRSNRKKPF